MDQMTETSFGVDVSKYQGTVDWARVKDSGITFAVARCVVENGVVDPTYARNVAEQRKVGLIPGAYAFLAGGGVAKDQAQTFIKTVGDPTGMVVMLDIERPKFHATPTVDDVKAFVAEWAAAHPHHPIFLYGSAGSVLGSLARAADLHALGPLWVAAYPKGAGLTPSAFFGSIKGDTADEWRLSFGGWHGPTIWQFTSTVVRVPGIAANVDTDAFRGTRQELLAFTG
jgi:lysozyme